MPPAITNKKTRKLAENIKKINITSKHSADIVKKPPIKMQIKFQKQKEYIK